MMRVLWTLLLVAAEVFGLVSNLLDKYHSHSEMTDILKSINNTHYNITNLYSIGKSTKGIHIHTV